MHQWQHRPLCQRFLELSSRHSLCTLVGARSFQRSSYTADPCLRLLLKVVVVAANSLLPFLSDVTIFSGKEDFSHKTSSLHSITAARKTTRASATAFLGGCHCPRGDQLQAYHASEDLAHSMVNHQSRVRGNCLIGVPSCRVLCKDIEVMGALVLLALLCGDPCLLAPSQLMLSRLQPQTEVTASTARVVQAVAAVRALAAASVLSASAVEAVQMAQAATTLLAMSISKASLHHLLIPRAQVDVITAASVKSLLCPQLLLLLSLSGRKLTTQQLQEGAVPRQFHHPPGRSRAQLKERTPIRISKNYCTTVETLPRPKHGSSLKTDAFKQKEVRGGTRPGNCKQCLHRDRPLVSL